MAAHVALAQVDPAALAVQSSCDSATDLINQGAIHHRRGELPQAEGYYRQALTISANNSDALNLLGVLAHQTQHHEQAIALIEAAIAHGRGHHNLADYHNGAGEAHRALGHLKQARVHFRKAIRLRPSFDAPQFNLGNLQQQQGEHRKAIEAFRRTLAINPAHPKAQFAIACSALELEDYANGWVGYQARHNMRTFEYPIAPELIARDLNPQALSALRNQRLLFVVEQGLGDELFFLRFVPALSARGHEVSYLPSEKLRPVLEQCSNVTLHGAHEDVSDFDHIFSICDIALVAGMRSRDDIPPPLPLHVPHNAVHPLGEVAEQLPRPWVGLTWRAGLVDNNYKSVPLESLLARFDGFSGTVFCLQRHPSPQALALIAATLPNIAVVDCSDLNERLFEMCVLLADLDHYLGVSNTNTHLYGSLSKSADVLVTMNSDFRWPSAMTTSPWYPTARAHKQCPDGSWETSLDAITVCR